MKYETRGWVPFLGQDFEKSVCLLHTSSPSGHQDEGGKAVQWRWGNGSIPYLSYLTPYPLATCEHLIMWLVQRRNWIFNLTYFNISSKVILINLDLLWNPPNRVLEGWERDGIELENINVPWIGRIIWQRSNSGQYFGKQNKVYKRHKNAWQIYSLIFPVSFCLGDKVNSPLLQN